MTSERRRWRVRLRDHRGRVLGAGTMLDGVKLKWVRDASAESPASPEEAPGG